MFNYLYRKFFFKVPQLGDNLDTRTEGEKLTAFDNREIAFAGSPIQWVEKSSWKNYPIKYQYYTGECVAQSTTKHLGINDKVGIGQYASLSAEFFYYYRSNRPDAGMIWLDAMNIATTKGACFNQYIEQRIRESDPVTVPKPEWEKEALLFRGQAYVEDKIRSMDSIAQIIDQQGSCLLWFWFDVNGQEWWKPYPSILFPNLGTYDAGATRHALVATDYGTINGKRYLKIEDSAGNNTAVDGQNRFIDENFLKRCFVAGYVIDLVTPPPVTKPKWTGTRTLTIGSKGDDVQTLQEILMLEGVFNYPNSTGFFGGATRKAVIALQNKYKDEILTPVGLTQGTGVCAKATLAWLSANYK